MWPVRPGDALTLDTVATGRLISTTLSVEQRAEAINETSVGQFADGLKPKPIDDTAMDLGQGQAPAIGPRGKKAGVACHVGVAAVVGSTHARPGNCRPA